MGFQDECVESIKANLTPRRLFALAVAIACIAICIAVLLGNLQLEIWQTAVVLVVGLLFFEWAG